MRKTLLLLSLFGATLSIQGQNLNRAIKPDLNRIKLSNTDQGINFAALGSSQSHYVPRIPRPNWQGGAKAVTKIKLTGSYNAFTLLVSESNCVTANQDINGIMFTHRISPDWSVPNVNSGFIVTHISNDFGTTWDSIIHTQDPVNLCRYPSGAFFNPSGNTVMTDAYGVVAGPITQGSGWLGNYFASTKLDNTNNNVLMALNANAGVPRQDFVRIGMQSTDDKVVLTGGIYGNPDGTTAAASAWRGATINKAVFNGTNFTWSVDSIKPNFVIDATDGTRQAFTIAQTAWSQNGQIGYVVFIGVDATATGPNLTYQPLVWKTTDGGATYNQMPLFDFASIPAINEKTRISIDGVTKLAWYSQEQGIDAVVDYQDNLHIFCKVTSGFSNAVDSVAYTYNYSSVNDTNLSYLFDTYTLTGGGWGARLVDSLKTQTAEINTPFIDNTSAPYPLDARLQMSISNDRKKIFYGWADSDPNNYGGENAAQDIYVQGYDFETNKRTYSKMFTNDLETFFYYLSNVTLFGGGTYKIPATCSLPSDWPGGTGAMADNPWDHYYIKGIEFAESDFFDNSELAARNLSNIAPEVSQNIPNPFNGSTLVTVNLVTPSNVTIEVSDALGNVVSTVDYGRLNSGKNNLTINADALSNGIYFYTVNAGASKVTRKMIVQK